MLVRAAELAGQRAVVAPGLNTLVDQQALPPTLYLLDGAPHAWLFPRMAAVVHYGGAGTTHAGLTAGKPTVVGPHAND